MATQHLHLAGASDILGFAPHRLAFVRRGYAPAIGYRRNVNARIMWQIDRVLSALYEAGRRSISILDADCGDGSLLRRIARRARAIGFVAIDARGLDRRETVVVAARQAAAAEKDPAIGLSFAVQEAGEIAELEAEAFDLTLARRADPGVPAADLARVTAPTGAIVRHD